MGISASSPAIDQAKMRDWIASVVEDLSKGVAGLFKKAGVRCMRGEARFRDGKTVFVKSAECEGRIRAEAIDVATGSVISLEPSDMAAPQVRRIAMASLSSQSWITRRHPPALSQTHQLAMTRQLQWSMLRARRNPGEADIGTRERRGVGWFTLCNIPCGRAIFAEYPEGWIS